jgi:hypothetical protein
MSKFNKFIEFIYRVFGQKQIDQRTQDYRDNFMYIQNIMAQNILESDKALMTFSLAALAALAAMNKDLFDKYGTLSFLTIVCFVLVALTVICGYIVSNELLKSARDRLTKNYIESPLKPLNDETQPLKFGNLSIWLNRISLGLFVLGFVLFLILLGLYIGGIQ